MVRLPPTEIILAWPSPNYVNPVTRGPALIIVNAVFSFLVVVTVGLRLYTRLVLRRWFGLDDIFIILALVFTLGLTTIVILANQEYGWDRHIWDIPFSYFEPAAKIAMAAKVVFTGAATFTRLSLHCFYYRLISDSGGKIWFKWLVHVNVAYTIAIAISFPFIAVFLCTPVRNYWTIGAPVDSCLDEGVATIVCGVISCIADFVTTVTPIPLIMGLQMPLRQKLAVAVLFAFGLIVTAAGIVRTWFIYRSLVGEYDTTWYAYPLWIAAAVEIDLGVICASAPVLRPLLSKIPFSLSSTLSRGISFKKSTGHSSNTQKPSAASSSRKAEAPLSVPELASDKGQSYELKHWVDAEMSLMVDGSEDGSEQDILADGSEQAILKEAAPPKKSIVRVLGKLKGSTEDAKEDMPITRTSEVRLQNDPASVRSSRRLSRHSTSLVEHRTASKPPCLPAPTARGQ
ncbi:hypothetical protein EJ02DRAFT_82359 [Clathrospora elynae]|uniref:Rhodopsin domain-containing protein n=1 Tax=Clathrospora elynae TaxID=706981 RepID=A0A6A5S902_9PLEO|nr:hypothetical protein EJ02DRAFT_82359 [Clathrospora elynae]